MPSRGSFKKLNHLRQLDSRKRPVILHAEAAWFDHILEGGCAFFERIGAGAHERGFKPLLVPAESMLSAGLLGSDHLQIVIGPRRPQGPKIFHAQPGYLRGFWYLDPKGYYWNSSLAGQSFDAQTVEPDAAAAFFEDVRCNLLGRNLSKRKQPVRCPGGLTPADAVIFVQDIEKYCQPVHFLSTAEMISAVCGAVTGKVYIKPHPLQDAAAQQRVRQLCSQHSNAVLSGASVHDLIAASGIVVSQNSAAGFEALMHRKPVLTCARTDYHHAALACKTPDALHDNLKRAAEAFADFPFEQYLYWFLGRHMLEPQKAAFEEQAWARLLSAQP